MPAMVKAWVKKILYFVVLITIVAALFGAVLVPALDKYAANDTTFGATVKTISLLLIGVGLVLLAVEEFLPGGMGAIRERF